MEWGDNPGGENIVGCSQGCGREAKNVCITVVGGGNWTPQAMIWITAAATAAGGEVGLPRADSTP